MAYEHARKAGNLADVWKHFTLLTVLADLVGEADPGPYPFTYLESHCGQGLYHLAPDGEWRHGIGRVLPLPGGLAGHPYFEAFAGSIQAGSVYRGSWLLVSDYLASRGRQASLSLYDTDPAVVDRAAAMGGAQDGRSVRLNRGDGFEAIAQTGGWHLVLIDPPYSPHRDVDTRRVRIAAGSLASRQIPFLVWYPLAEPSSSSPPGAGVGFELVWEGAGGRRAKGMAGCGVLAGGGAARSLAAHAEEFAALAAHLGAGFRVLSAGQGLGRSRTLSRMVLPQCRPAHRKTRHHRISVKPDFPRA